MPVRILREGILTSERVDQLSPEGEVFYRRLLSVVDDFGRYYANPKLLRSACFPLKEKLESEQVLKWVDECVRAGLIIVYQHEGKDYLEVERFGQQVRAKKSKFPEKIANAKNPLADAKQITEPAHLVGDVGEVGDGDVIEDEGGDGGAVGEIEPTRAVEIAVFLRRSGIDGANASNPLLIEWADNPKVTDDLLETAVGMVRERKATRPGPRYIAPIIAQLLNPQANAPPGKLSARDESRMAAAASIGLGAKKNDELGYIDGDIREVP
jgi:hypothetical protein